MQNLRVLWTLFLLTGCQVVSGMVQPYSTDLETTLRTTLFNGYEVFQRPSERVIVQISLNLITINGLDIRDQVLSTSAYFTMKWTDQRLDWSSNSTYDNIRFIFSNEDYMWRPAVAIENGVNDLSVFSDENTLIRVASSGTAIWTPGGIFETSCDADVTYYPLDTQTCSIVLTTWAYTANEVNIELSSEPIVMDHFSENGEWELIESSTSTTSSSRRYDSNSYDRLYFTLKLKRRPLFHIFNTILPVLLMASLIIFVFKLPPESGERIGMSLTVLLAYAVYLTLISDNIPKTSLSASILSTYLTIILMLSTLSVIFTIVVLDIYFNHSDDEEPPTWFQKFTRIFLVRFAMWKGHGCCQKTKVDNVPSAEDGLNTEHKINTPGNTSFAFSKSNTVLEKEAIKNDDSTGSESSEPECIYSWKEVALILDRCFMYLFIFAVVVTTLICLVILIVGDD
ncbi:hypothetical protein ACF0H5_023471 [Mactra antiquata]